MSRKRDQIGLVLALGARYALAVILLMSGFQKLVNPYVFLENVYQYQIFDKNTGLLVTGLLPIAELTLSVFLLAGELLAGCSLIATGFGVSFMLIQLSALVHGLSINCGCFGGSAEDTIGFASILRALCVTVLALLTWRNSIVSSSGLLSDSVEA